MGWNSGLCFLIKLCLVLFCSVNTLLMIPLFFLLQLIPRTVWLDHNQRQLKQWPVKELNTLRGKKVVLSHQKLLKGHTVEVKGITAAQVCDITFYCC